ncbi:hypothetical protein ACMZYS_12720, partial [Pseudomonas syringae pv. actinidiae]
VHRLGVEVHFFDFCVGSHHEVLAPEKNREHSIELQLPAWNVGFMRRLRLIKIAIDKVNLSEPLSRALQANSFRVLKPHIKDRVRLERLVVWIHEAVGSDHVARSERCELQQSTAISLFTKEHLVYCF